MEHKKYAVVKYSIESEIGHISHTGVDILCPVIEDETIGDRPSFAHIRKKCIEFGIEEDISLYEGYIFIRIHDFEVIPEAYCLLTSTN